LARLDCCSCIGEERPETLKIELARLDVKLIPSSGGQDPAPELFA
jgi:hypothetical protein